MHKKKSSKLRTLLQSCIEKCTVCLTICNSMYKKETLYTHNDFIFSSLACINSCSSCILELNNILESKSNYMDIGEIESCIEVMTKNIDVCNIAIEQTNNNTFDISMYKNCANECSNTIAVCIQNLI